MDSRSEILQRLNRQSSEQVALPEVIDGDWIDFPDLQLQLTTTIQTAGGSCEILDNVGQLADRLNEFDAWRSAENVFSAIPELPGNVQLEKIDDPHDLENLDFVVYRGQFAVAENGAIWLTDTDLKHRVAFFIAQFLVLVVDRQAIVATMHQAYSRAKVPQPGFGLFLSGPSKTADIEQSLVIGAHGCRQLLVYLV
ncbi:MAG: LUD domain-containing protein [Planctomycetales bacterium]|nr:LUD domain-containing protein [Planctomycetales bacterium]